MLSTLIPFRFSDIFGGCFQRWKPRKTWEKVKKGRAIIWLGRKGRKVRKGKKGKGRYLENPRNISNFSIRKVEKRGGSGVKTKKESVAKLAQGDRQIGIFL